MNVCSTPASLFPHTHTENVCLIVEHKESDSERYDELLREYKNVSEPMKSLVHRGKTGETR